MTDKEKVYDVHGLLEMIANGEIKENSKFSISGGTYDEFIAFYRDGNIIINYFGKEMIMGTKYLSEECIFELIEDEEKEAIRYFNECITKDRIYEEDLTLSFMKTILNLIEKQDKRIKELEKALINDDYKYRQEIEKKDKIINKMAEELWNEHYLYYKNILDIDTIEGIIEYFEKKEEV